MSDEYLIRPARVDDAPIVAQQRTAMFQDMGSISQDDSELLRGCSEPWLAVQLSTGYYVGWLVEHRGTVVAGGGIVVREVGPVPGCYRVGRQAHIVNVYTDRSHRRRGLARRLMKTMLDWCESNRIDHIVLSASDEGRPLYESLGFKPTSEMRLSKPGVG